MSQLFQNICDTVRDYARYLGTKMSLSAKVNILNELPKHDSATVVDNVNEVSDIDVKLQKLVLRMQGRYLSDDGHSVDYEGLKSSSMFGEFTTQALRLNHVSLEGMTQDRVKAFFINVYNVLTIHGIAVTDPLPKSVTDLKNFWKTTAYIIGSHVYTLDDIEHGILRSNKRHPGSLIPEFSSNDPRLKYSLQLLDPRIHFALNCGAKSCPAIRVYNEENISYALDSATKSFIEGEVELHETEVKLSKLFQWYGSDFGGSSKEILRWILPYVPSSSKDELAKLIKDGTYKIVYKDYNWALNVS